MSNKEIIAKRRLLLIEGLEARGHKPTAAIDLVDEFVKAIEDKARAEGILESELIFKKNMERIITHLKTQKQEQVRKLKANINSTCDWKNSELNTLIDEIFAECAEKDKA